MRLDWTTLALQIVNFAILVWLLQRFLYRPVLRVIDARRAALAAEQARAVRETEAAGRQVAELQAQRAGLAAERAAALTRAAEESRQLLATAREQAQRDAQRLMEETRGTLARERERSQEELRRAALELAGDLARRALAEIPESLRVQAWLERIEAHLKALAAAELAELAREVGGGDALRVVTAWPIAPAAEEQWRTRLAAALGSKAPIAFETDPGLIAGAALCFPHAKLSFCVKDAIEALQEEVCRRGSGG